MDHQSAADVLDHTHDVRRNARNHLRAFWFPLVVFGSITLFSAAVVVLAGDEALAVYWPVVGTGGAVLTGWYYHRRQRRLGLLGSPTPYIVTAAGIMVGAMLAGGLGAQWGSGLAGAVGPTMVAAAGYFVFARLERSMILATLAAALFALALGVALSGMETEPATAFLAVASGAASLATGVGQRLWTTDPR